MNIAWCPRHRGVMRIAFFDTTDHPHFNKPCPRCGERLEQQTRGKYETRKQEPNYTSYQDWVDQQNRNKQLSILDTIESDDYTYPPSREDYWASTYTPTGELCSCCRFFSVRPEVDLCGWCVDCPTRYCDVPNRFKNKKINLMKGNL